MQTIPTFFHNSSNRPLNPSDPNIATANRAKQVFQAESRRLALQHYVSTLVSPSALWDVLLEYRTQSSSVPPLTEEKTVTLEDAENTAPPNDDDDSTTPTSNKPKAAGTNNLTYEELSLSYDDYRAAAISLVGEANFHTHPILGPKTFATQPRREDGTISIVSLFTSASKKLLLYQIRAQLEVCSTAQPGTSTIPPRLCQEDLEQFLADILPHLRLSRDVAPWLLPYYLCHCAQKFFFLCDVQSTRSISVDQLLRCEAFTELLSLYEVEKHHAVLKFRTGSIVEVAARKAQPFSDSAVQDKQSEEDIDAANAALKAAMESSPDDEPLVEGTVVGSERNGDREDDLYVVELTSAHPGVMVQVPRAFVFFPTVSQAIEQTSQNFDDVTRSGNNAAAANWFSLPAMSRVYQHFCSLDTDSDGMLTVEELKRYNNGSFTDLAIRRVFEVHVHRTASDPTGERMDFKTFIDFVLATEHTDSRGALKYFWPLLDLNDTHSYIENNVLRFFCNEVSEQLKKEGLMDITGDSILSEIVDMVDPAEVDRISLVDLEKSKRFGTIVPLLLDFRWFYNYDCREQAVVNTPM